MWTSPAKLIRAYIARLAEDTLFTTRQLLGRGKRAATDQALYRMVRAGKIRRVARGVFVRDPSGTKSYSIEEIAKVKSGSFSRKACEHPTTTWQIVQHGRLTPKAKVYSINARSSSFKTGQTTILFEEHCERKLALAENKMGRRVRALWSLGRKNFDEHAFRKALLFCNGGEGKQWLKRNYALLPWWLMDRFMDMPGFRIAPADRWSLPNYRTDELRLG